MTNKLLDEEKHSDGKYNVGRHKARIRLIFAARI